uniref:Ionotropic glutamate receptor L-glutamate and glycine-binding domain-containing protein n=1 Tax=Anopheles funestus TaxID=62324 RepID=A0A182RM80_ANOFN
MPEAVVPCCLVLLLLLLYAAADQPCAESDRDLAGVDLISRTPSSLEAHTIIRERLIVLEQRFVRMAQDPCTEHRQLIVFLQLRTTSDVDDDILALVIATFTRQSLALRVVYRVESVEKVEDMVISIRTTAGNDSSCIMLIMLLPDLACTDILFPSTVRAFPLALKLILLANGSPTGECPAEDDLYTASALLSDLWQREHIVRIATIWYRCSTNFNAMLVGLFDLFKPSNDSSTWGIFYTVTDLNRSLPTDLERFGRNMNLQGLPIDIYGFEAAMAYRRQDIDMMPQTFPTLRPGTHNASAGLLDTLFGADVDALRELALRMNFTPRVYHTRANFGFKMANGTFTGVLGRLLTRESWLSMNVYFLKDYETRDLQFSAGVYQDSLCVFVRAAGMLPNWLLIFRCFTPTLWIIVWSTVVLVSLCYLALSQLIAVCRPTISQHVKKGSEHTYRQDRPQQDRTGLVGQIVGALLTAPTNGFQRTTAHQKLFVAFGLIWGLTITGAFQGSLVDVYTTPTSMKNLDTLAELDASGLTITVTAPALIVDVFGTERPGSTIGNLKQRLVIEHTPVRSSSHAVLAGLTAGLIRNQDFVRLSTKHLGADGIARLHRLRECPRSYTLAYLYPRGSPLYRAANDHILHFLQHGLYAKWQRDAAHLLAMNRALKVHARYIRSGRPEQGEQVTLRLDHLLLPFMLLGAGLCLGMVCFLWERYCRARRYTYTRGCLTSDR